MTRMTTQLSESSMNAIIDLQLISERCDIPSQQDMQFWVDTLLSHLQLVKKEITVRIVDEQEIQQLNQQYRGKDSTTNVLSFPFDMPEVMTSDDVQIDDSLSQFLGDIVICAAVVQNESEQQDKLINHHWAHLLIHGVLHLVGYDHIETADAEEMESIEIAVLQKLSIDDPY